MLFLCTSTTNGFSLDFPNNCLLFQDYSAWSVGVYKVFTFRSLERLLVYVLYFTTFWIKLDCLPQYRRLYRCNIYFLYVMSTLLQQIMYQRYRKWARLLSYEFCMGKYKCRQYSLLLFNEMDCSWVGIWKKKSNKMHLWRQYRK